MKRLSPDNLAALAGNDVNYPDNTKAKNQIKIPDQAELERGTTAPVGIHRDQLKIRSALRREHLRQMSHAQQFQHARCHVGELKGAWPLLDCGRLEANQRAEARAIQMFYITKVDNDATAKRNEGPYQLFYLTRGVTDQIAMTLDCRHLVPVFIFIFRLLKFTA
jgi:hypothetical protein